MQVDHKKGLGFATTFWPGRLRIGDSMIMAILYDKNQSMRSSRRPQANAASPRNEGDGCRGVTAEVV